MSERNHLSATLSAAVMETAEEQEAVLFHSYPCAYYVQSPSTLSHANSSDIRNPAEVSTCHSPLPSDTFPNAHHHHHRNPTQEASRFTLSHYSSSRGSNHGAGTDNGEARLIVGRGNGGDCEEEEEEGEGNEEGYYGKRKRGCWKRYFTYRNSDSNAWICLQLSWRAIFSMGIALLVFYIVTNPPSPIITVKVGEIEEFMLGEGVDKTGVGTKILTCNCTMDVIVDNHSKLFGLHILPPSLHMSFGPLPIAASQGPRLYAESGRTRFRLSVGTSNKAMYGAGRDMEDKLDSGIGLELTIRLNFISNYRVVWKFISPHFHRHVQCLLLLRKPYDRNPHTRSFNSTCFTS
ncbi:uncharacterized protein LOC101209149 [Cucumis sativus]|uniref:Late embryogenesis abundant protein LEA-2 subgroup domain-containing protein n=1 Tax=Cucumis sativus TaxID=3659 RepID=A0A0A0LD21_CUCSA|nr:uncharacterized protein LOC101209149 [Cucumis sativus]KGN58592.1 hypothetical protein Csa_002328 [Cucumis sativus]